MPDGLKNAVEDAIYSPLKAMGGCFSAEHGIGSKRIAALRRYSDPVKLDLMRQIKQLLDPQDLCNPGKVAPWTGADD